MNLLIIKNIDYPIKSILSRRIIFKRKLSCFPEKNLKIVLSETPKKQNCPVRPTFGEIVLLDRRPPIETRLYRQSVVRPE